jgi:TonB family protein
VPETWRECEGQVVDGQFTLVKHLGGSDHSVVFLTQRGKDKTEKAAIKFVQADAAKAEAQISRWKSAAQLSHPNLIRIFESGRCQLAGLDLLYVVMEYASENLAEFLPQRALSPEEARDMLEPFVDALAFLHRKGFVHRSIKPGNILAIDDQLRLSSDSIRRIGETRIVAIKDDAYTPPEGLDGESSEAGDVWSLGATLVESLTQRLPDRGAGDKAGPPLPDTLPQPFLDIARHCLQPNPKQRWTIAEISAKLNPKAAPIPAPTETQDIPAAKPTAAAAEKAQPETKPSSPAKPTSAPTLLIDPLSVPLSKVSPVSGARKLPSLDNQVIAGKKSSGRYYLVVAVLLALTVGAVLAIPRFRGHQAEAQPDASTETGYPASQSSLPPASLSANVAPAPPAKSPQKAEQPPTTKNDPARDSQETDAEKPSPKKDSSASASAAPASLRSAVPRSEAVPAAPFVADREASIKKGVVTPGEVLNQVVPEVSEKSRNTIRGTVRTIIKIHVDATGAVSSAQLAAGGSKFFADAALDAARQWDFAPAKIDGHAVPSEWLLHFDFTPTETKVTPLATKP